MMPENQTIRLHEALPTLPGLRVRAQIDTEALLHNYETLLGRVRAVSPATEAIAVVKADAYGHGIRPVVSTLYRAGCRRYAVSCIEEAIALRTLLGELCAASSEPPDAPACSVATDGSHILILGYTPPAYAPLLAAHNITTALLSEAHADALAAAAAKAGVRIKVHIALDTGMNRIGYPVHTAAEECDTVAAILRRFGRANGAAESVAEKSPSAKEDNPLILDGLFTHFARADEDYDTEILSSNSLTARQYARYRRVLDALTANGLRPRVCHICNSAASVRFPAVYPDAMYDAVRLGINLYGYGVPPHEDGGTTRPVMRLVTVVSHVHTLAPGETVGYGGTYSAPADANRTLITLPIGYADGWLRAFTGASVSLHTEAGDFSVPLVGRICMDQCMADITDLPADVQAAVTPGTPVTLFGSTAAALEGLAMRAGTIPYELLCLITARVPRVWPSL